MLFLLYTIPAPAFFPEPNDVAVKVGKQARSLSSFQAVLSFPDYPEFSCNLWVKGHQWRQELIETHGGIPRVVQAILGTDTRLSAVFPAETRAPLPWLLVWKFPMDRWITPETNPQSMSYQFLSDRPCLVVGESTATQYWIDNEREIPVRVIWQADAGSCDLIWDECSRVGTFWLPHQMRFTGNHDSVLHVRIRWNGINIPLQNTLFSADAFNRQFFGKDMYLSSSPLVSQLEAFPLTVSTRP